MRGVALPHPRQQASDPGGRAPGARGTMFRTLLSRLLGLLGQASKPSKLEIHGFDLDSYKILVKPIMLKTVKVETVF